MPPLALEESITDLGTLGLLSFQMNWSISDWMFFRAGRCTTMGRVWKLYSNGRTFIFTDTILPNPEIWCFFHVSKSFLIWSNRGGNCVDKRSYTSLKF
ncbi:hypothetical protein FKM82_028185 [Ascaphus truei]